MRNVRDQAALRTRARAAVLVIAALVVLGPVGVAARPVDAGSGRAKPALFAQVDTAADERAFADGINEVRAAAGLPALAMEVNLVDVSRAWSERMVTANVLSHNQALADQAPANWLRLGENVGVGSTVDSIHRAFVNSPAHLANIVGRFNFVGIGVVRAGSRIWVTQVFMQAPSGSVVQTASTETAPVSGTSGTSAASGDGYRLVASTGGVFDFGTSSGFGGVPSGSRIVGGAATPSRNGYWAVSENGTVHARGDAPVLGGVTGGLSAPIVGMAASPTGRGYWLLGRDGGVFAFGDAEFFGSTGALRLNKPVVGITASPTGRGYWFVASDGGIFAFGDAAFHGSAGAIPLNQPIVGMAASPSGNGYWLVARDGGIFAFGDAAFHGSTGDIRLNQPIVGMAPTASGQGYRFVAADGGIFNFGDAIFHGSGGGMGLGQSVVGMLAG